MTARQRAWGALALLLVVVSEVVDEAIADLLNSEDLEQASADRLVRVTDAARELGGALRELSEGQ